jgi:glycosidase
MKLDETTLKRETERSLNRLLPRLEQTFSRQIKRQPQEWQAFRRRLESNYPQLFRLYYQLYASQYDFFYFLEELLTLAGQSWFERPADLKSLDAGREADPNWFQSQHMLGGVCYVDLFAGSLAGLRSKLPYFQELGLTYLHLMPLFLAPEGDNDGGYAVSDYRRVNPSLGSMAELAELGRELRQAGISLVLDLVFNHTSDEHTWAEKALAGDEEHRECYRIFPDRRMPDAYEQTLREIFPDEHPGAFSYRAEIDSWVWTTFHSYQWDLNYANPQVFNRMAAEMLYLANVGVEVLRLDAVAFIWKQMGTACENLPEAHLLIQAFNSMARIAAPALFFKSEAIVHPDEVVRYIHPQECQLSYNPLVMALLWNSLATRDVRLLRQALVERFKINPQCAWVNYVRCHDDIGWTFSDEDAARLGINASDHRKFLNTFYTGRFAGSFARGLPFQENPKTGDARISGTCASLAGLEKALKEETEKEVELAVRRILLIHGVIMTVGGIPLIYLGDELAMLNDYSYRDDPAKSEDSRWVHRPAYDWQRHAQRQDETTVAGRVYQGLQRLAALRKRNPVFSGASLEVVDSGSPQVLAYLRLHAGKRALVLANFSEAPQLVPANVLRLALLSYQVSDLATGNAVPMQDLRLEPFQFVCLTGDGE